MAIILASHKHSGQTKDVTTLTLTRYTILFCVGIDCFKCGQLEMTGPTTDEPTETAEMINMRSIIGIGSQE
jgi:hypothetical protein